MGLFGGASRKVVDNRMYFMARGDGVAKCPKCKKEITTPRKTWKITVL